MNQEFDFGMFNAEVEKQFGKDAVTSLDKRPTYGSPGTFIPTSIESLNSALGIGGIPVGRITEIFGLEASGKTTLALDLCAQAQRLFPDRPVFYGDSEYALNLEIAQALGVDLSAKRFILAQTSEAERMLDLTYKAAKHGACLVVNDSVAGLSLKSDMEDDETTEARVGGISKAFRAHLKRMNSILTASGCTAIYLNHITMKPGVIYGNPETQPGGKGLPFFASVRMDVRVKERMADKSTGEVRGQVSKVKVVKNKLAPPYRSAEFTIIYGQGIDIYGPLIDAVIEAEVLTKSGTWFKLGEDRWQGRAALIEALKGQPALEGKLRAALQKARK